VPTTPKKKKNNERKKQVMGTGLSNRMHLLETVSDNNLVKYFVRAHVCFFAFIDLFCVRDSRFCYHLSVFSVFNSPLPLRTMGSACSSSQDIATRTTEIDVLDRRKFGRMYFFVSVSLAHSPSSIRNNRGARMGRQRIFPTWMCKQCRVCQERSTGI
jgi:hypothetical protein